MAEKFILLCGCGWKRVSDLSDKDLTEIKNDTLSSKKFRCPLCGFTVTPRKAKDPQADMDRIQKDKETAEENKKWLEDSLKRQNEFMKEIEHAEEDNDQ